jgi:hypothetical protein
LKTQKGGSEFRAAFLFPVISFSNAYPVSPFFAPLTVTGISSELPLASFRLLVLGARVTFPFRKDTILDFLQN